MGDAPALALLEALPRARALSSGGWQACCPAHEDRMPSLSWDVGRDGQVLLTCHAGCATEDVVAAMGLAMADLFPPREEPYPPLPRTPVATVVGSTEYTIRDRAGEAQAIHVRNDMSDGGKRMSWKLPDGSLGLRGRPTGSLPLYMAHGLDRWPSNEPVLLVEGEKAAQALVRAGFPAVGTVTGASGRPSDEVLRDLEGRVVHCWPDADQQGRAHMLDIAHRLDDIAAVGWIEPPPDAPKGWDAADLLSEPDGIARVRQMIRGSSAVIPDLPTTTDAPEAPEGVAGPRTDRTLLRLADVIPERVTWLWKDRIPMGKVTVVDGDPGQGKSTMTLDLAARVSRGLPMPDGGPGVGPATVLILSAEDDPADTIRPRLEAAGADLERVLALREVGDRLPSLPVDIPAIEEEVIARQVALVVVDPLMAYLGGDVNGHRDQDVRRALAPLSMMAQRTGAAVVLVRHLNKQSGGSAMYRGGGSIGITGAARSVLLVAPDPDAGPDEQDPRRIVAVVKSNLAPMAPSLAYRLVTDASTGVEVGRVAWEEGPTGHLASDLLATPDRDRDNGALSFAQGFLADLLSDGPMKAEDVKAMARDEDISPATLKRAKASVGVVSRREGFGRGSVVWWSLPGHSGSSGAIEAQPQRMSPYANDDPLWGLPAHTSPQDAQEAHKALNPEDEHLVQQMSILCVEEDHPRSAWDPDPEPAPDWRESAHRQAVAADLPTYCKDCHTLHPRSRTDMCEVTR